LFFQPSLERSARDLGRCITFLHSITVIPGRGACVWRAEGTARDKANRVIKPRHGGQRWRMAAFTRFFKQHQRIIMPPGCLTPERGGVNAGGIRC